MEQKWMMVHVTDNKVLEDVKQCIAIRRGRNKIKNRG
jgi:AraC family transcriptional regulator